MTTNPDLYNLTPSTIVMYSTVWCPDCKRSRKFLDGHRISYIDVDIGKDKQAVAFLEGITNARIHIPTIIFPDGKVLIEPTDEELGKKLNVR